MEFTGDLKGFHRHTGESDTVLKYMRIYVDGDHTPPLYRLRSTRAGGLPVEQTIPSGISPTRLSDSKLACLQLSKYDYPYSDSEYSYSASDTESTSDADKALEVCPDGDSSTDDDSG